METYRRRVKVGRRVFNSIAAAATALKITSSVARARVISTSDKWKSWKYISPDEGRTVVRKNDTVRHIVYFGIAYASIAEAAAMTDDSQTTIRYRLRNPKLKDCYYVLKTGKHYKGEN